ncbi:hypothetical protein Vafri_11850 [Volvox africanus]|uniref:Secreted protein n=1 Tax=Volvox africanus TaxID=51714 RepID=A0A8J4B9R6_9CHLO|nr:hypothetical protein Vafri_11850 [Volvox africanus]
MRMATLFLRLSILQRSCVASGDVATPTTAREGRAPLSHARKGGVQPRSPTPGLPLSAHYAITEVTPGGRAATTEPLPLNRSSSSCTPWSTSASIFAAIQPAPDTSPDNMPPAPMATEAVAEPPLPTGAPLLPLPPADVGPQRAIVMEPSA